MPEHAVEHCPSQLGHSVCARRTIIARTGSTLGGKASVAHRARLATPRLEAAGTVRRPSRRRRRRVRPPSRLERIRQLRRRRPELARDRRPTARRRARRRRGQPVGSGHAQLIARLPSRARDGRRVRPIAVFRHGRPVDAVAGVARAERGGRRGRRRAVGAMERKFGLARTRSQCPPTIRVGRRHGRRMLDRRRRRGIGERDGAETLVGYERFGPVGATGARTTRGLGDGLLRKDVPWTGRTAHRECARWSALRDRQRGRCRR